jgi:hypothetical protein
MIWIFQLNAVTPLARRLLLFGVCSNIVKDRAQGLVEYGLIIALVAVLAIAGLIIFGPAVSALLSTLGGSV